MGCTASVEDSIRSPEQLELDEQKRQQFRALSEASKYKKPENYHELRTLTKAETQELMDSVLGDIAYQEHWMIPGKLYWEDPVPKLMEALEKANARFTDYEFDIGENHKKWMATYG